MNVSLRSLRLGVIGLIALAAAGAPERTLAVEQLAEVARSAPPEPGTNPAYDTGLKAMAADPGNAQKILDFVEVAIKAGDLEGAIAALERLLIFNPELPSVRTQLGILYYRLGSYALARNYLERGLASADVPSDLATQGRQYLALASNAEDDNRFAGSLTVGLRGQSNANAGPDNGISRILGFDALLTTNFQNRDDLNAFGSLSLNHVFDPHWVSGITWESNASLYGAKQFHLINLSLAAASIDTGPRIPVEGWDGDLSVRPYFIGNGILLGGSMYYSAWGGGVSVVAPVAEDLSVTTSAEAQDLSYHATSSRPRVDARSGPAVVFTVRPTYALSGVDAIGLTAQYSRILARGGYEAYYRYALLPTYYRQFETDFTDAPWQLSAFAGPSWSFYDEPDILIDPGERRHDREWDAGVTLTVPVVDNISTQFQLQNTWVASNIPNYKYENFTGQMAVTLGF